MEEKRNVTVNGEESDISPPPVWLHNWMYSIVPGPNFEIYLAGFCKNCKKAFTKRLTVDRAQLKTTDVRYTRVEDLEKYGCKGP